MYEKLIDQIEDCIKGIKLLDKSKFQFVPDAGFSKMTQKLQYIKEEIETNSYSKSDYGIGHIVADSWPLDHEISKKLSEIEMNYKILQKRFFEKQKNDNNNSQSVKM